MRKLYYYCLIVIIVVLLFTNKLECSAAEYTGGLNALNDAIKSEGTSDLLREFFQTENINTDADLGEISIPSSVLTISTKYSNSYSIDGQGLYGGISTKLGQTFNINTASISGKKYLTLQNFSNNNSGGVISNSGATNIKSARFSNNFAQTNGGAIQNSSNALLNIINTDFVNNRANGLGGAIYNEGELNIFAQSGGQVLFSNNKDSSSLISSAIYLKSGVLNLDAQQISQIVFDDKISSFNSSNTININNSSTTNAGRLIFNESISDSTINSFGGILTFGKNNNNLLTDSVGNTSNTYLNNINLSATNTNIDLANKNAEDAFNLTNFTSNSSSLMIDANLQERKNDIISASSATGTIQVSGVNILKDSAQTSGTFNIFNGQSPTISGLTAYTDLYKYVMTSNGTGGLNYTRTTIGASQGLKTAIWATDANRSFSLNENYTLTAALTTMGGTNSTLSIFANNYNINHNNYGNFGIVAGMTMNIYDVGSINGETVSASWHGSNSSSGGIFYNSGNLNLYDSVFSLNSAGTHAGVFYAAESAVTKVYNSAFVQNRANGDGGVIRNLGKLYITNSLFLNNESNYGGAINNYKTYSGSPFAYIYDSTFKGNIANSLGGAICNGSSASLTVQNSIFENNYSTSTSGKGGAIYNEGPLTVVGSYFKGNYIDKGTGGAIYSKLAAFNISDSSFFDNGFLSEAVIVEDGGAIFNTGSTINSVSNSNFINNAAANTGGAIYSDAGTMTVTDSYFEKNYTSGTTYGFGGAVYTNNSQFNIYDSVFVNNGINSNNQTLTQYGGAIYNGQTTLKISNSYFDSNKSLLAGGAIYNKSNLTITNSIFENNVSSGIGGAISNIYKLYLKGDGGVTRFSNNSDSTGSNAIYSSDSLYINTGDSANTGVIGEVTFDDVVKGTQALYSDGACAIYINDPSVDSNLTNGTVNFNNNVSAYTMYQYGGVANFKYNPDIRYDFTISGGIANFLSYYSKIVQTGGSVNFGSVNAPKITMDNYSKTLTTGNINFINTDFLNNSKIVLDNSSSTFGIISSTFSGSNINNTDSALKNTSGTLNIQNSTLYNNSITAPSAKGGIIQNTSSLNIENSTFKNNYANSTTESVGGAIFTDTASNLTIKNSSFENNYTTGTNISIAGAIFIKEADYLIENTDFKGNYATATSEQTNAGALYIHASNGSITGGTFSDNGKDSLNNAVTNYGGAIYNSCPSKTTYIEGTTFENNAAKKEGGAIFNSYGDLRIDNAIFKGNYVYSGDGGAIYTFATTTIKNSSFENNYVQNDGLGGAIYSNGATTNILADSSKITLFSGNYDSTGSNAIYLADYNGILSVLNLNANSNGIIKFDDKITSSSIDNIININSTTVEPLMSKGQIVFNNTIKDSTINVYDGTLSLGEDNNTITNTYFSNVNLHLQNSSLLDMANKKAGDILNINNLTLGENTSISLDADLKNNLADTINVSGNASGKFNISEFNILQDSESVYSSISFLNAVNGGSISEVIFDNFKAFTTDYEYIFTQKTSQIGSYDILRTSLGGINYAIKDTTATRTFSATKDTSAEYNLGVQGGDSSILNINGNGYSINGGGFSGVSVLSNQTLNISNVGSMTLGGDIHSSWNGFVSENGGAITNNGKVNIQNSIFYNNTANENGGVIYNNGGIVTVKNSIFNSNKALNGFGGAIYNSGNLYIIAENSNTSFSGNIDNTGSNAIFNEGNLFLNSGSSSGVGNIIFNDKISSQNGDIYINSSLPSGAPVNGTVIFNKEIQAKSLNISSGSVNLNEKIKNTEINMNGGTTTLSNTASLEGNTNFILNGTSAVANINGIPTDGSNYSGAKSLFSVQSGTLNLNGADGSNYKSATNGGFINNSATTNIINTSLTSNTSEGLGGAIYNKSGTVNIIAASTKPVVFSQNRDKNGSNAIYLAQGATLNLNVSSGSKMIFDDKISSDGFSNKININKSYVSGDSTSPLANSPTNGNVILNNSISNSQINLYGGALSLSHDSYLDGNKLAMWGGTLNMVNNNVGTMALNSLALNGNSNLKLDVDLANGLADKITASNVSGSGILKINSLNLLSDTTNKNTNIEIASANLKNYIQLDSDLKSVESAIYKYNVSYNSSTGGMNFYNTHEFTPSIQTPQISSSIGSFLTQTNTYHEAFGNMESYMMAPRYDRLMMRMQNKTASADENFVFSPIFTQEESKGLWFKQFTTFENVPLNNGPNVSNVSYGMLIGGDTELENLGHGYSGYTTMYAGYNGSHQNYDSVGTYQNGGLLGVTRTIYKGDFFAALTGNVGVNVGNASTTSGTDNFTSLVAGLALKTGYNFELLSGKLIFQPTYSMSYTFVNTFDYTTSSGVGITSDPLNAIQISPGFKLIANMENGWQPYIGANMVWNVMDTQKFYADNAQLPTVSISPYVEYGFGAQRKWGDRFTGYGQVMFRGGGRNGVAFQFGLRIAIGKKNK